MSTTQFSESYAQVYDLFHHDKPYAAEVSKAIENFSSNQKPQNVCDTACGTGRHLVEFARHGLQVYGNDLSQGMLAAAEKRLAHAQVKGFALRQGDMKDVAFDANGIEIKFDLVTSFYTAMGYLVSSTDLNQFLSQVYSILRPGGLFFADNWNGHVMASKFSPSRERKFENDQFLIHRISKVAHLIEKNALKVDFDIKSKNKKDGTTIEFNETHTLRYFTPFELKTLFEAHGFVDINYEPFFDDASRAEDSWNFSISARRPRS